MRSSNLRYVAPLCGQRGYERPVQRRVSDPLPQPQPPISLPVLPPWAYLTQVPVQPTGQKECNACANECTATQLLNFPLQLHLVSVPPVAAAAASGSDTNKCFQLRTVDRNMQEIAAAALRASGLGEGAGVYLHHTQVADLSGR